jgi:hypothetical protein
MKHLKTYESFNSVDSLDKENFILIFNSLYENHLSIDEKLLIESNYGLINESWFSDLVDKGKRKALKVASDAGKLLVDLATKAKDILDFAKQLASKIGDYVKGQFTSIKDRVKNYAMKDSGFGSIILDFLEKKKSVKLKGYILDISVLLKYIISGQMITDLVTRLSEVFSKVLNLGTNEGISYLQDEFLFEAEETEEKKSFLHRLGEKVMSFPPFSWIPRIEELMNKGISAVSKIIDRFFSWISTGKDSEGSRFQKGFIFIFQILELYIHYKIVGKIDKFKEFLSKASGLEELTNQLKDNTMSEIWSKCGISPDEITNKVKDAIKKIPYVGDILSILDSLVMSVGVYLSVEPVLKKITS